MKMYFIAHVLPEHLNQRVLVYKQMMHDKFDCKAGLKSPAHITFVPPFWMEDEKETGLLDDLKEISGPVKPFAITTAGFSAFIPRTIFIDIAINKALIDVKSCTDHYFCNNPHYKIKTEKRAFHPHITIATRDLYKKAFYEAWSLFENKEFTEQWTASGLSLLRHNTQNWEVIYTSTFNG
jgi:2'-5' RNA ligase